MKDFFAVGGDGYTLLLLVFAACVVGLILTRSTRPRKKTRAEELQEQYKVLTTETLADIPDEQLVTAVVANAMGKLTRRHPDPLMTLPKYSRGRCVVYFVWLMLKEIEHGGVQALKNRSAVRFNDMGLEGLKAIEAHTSAAAIEAFLNADGDMDAVEDAIKMEQPIDLLIEYIRLNPEEFIDE